MLDKNNAKFLLKMEEKIASNKEKFSISDQEIYKIAKLASVNISNVNELKEDIVNMISFVGLLNDVDTSDISNESTQDVKCNLRKDIVTNDSNREEILHDNDKTTEMYFTIPCAMQDR